MDTATTASEGSPEETVVGRSPSIGAPRIPAPPHPERPPSPVPSVAVPSLPGRVGQESEVSAGRVPGTVAPSRPAPAEPTGAAGGTADRSDSPDSPGSGDDPFEMAFPPGVATKLGWYVYLLCEPRAGRPVLVGRGRGDRCFDHVRAARGPWRGPDDGSPPSVDGDHRSDAFPGLDQIRRVEAADGPVRVEILRWGMSADEAKLAEVVATDALGMPVDTKRRSQRQAASELGARLAKRAKFKQEHPTVLLRIGGQGAGTEYEEVRHGWRIGRRWTDPRGPHSPRWAVLVAGELVVAVYRIEGWEPTPLPGPPGPPGPSRTARSTYRHSFIGERDDRLEGRYLGRSVASYLGTGIGARTGTGVPPAIGAPNQVAYVWCGPHGADRPG